jgi:hypothetical protein
MKGRHDPSLSREATPERVRAVLELAGRTDIDQTSQADRHDPDLLEAASRQRRIALLLQSGGPATPETLRARLDTLEDGSRRRGPSVPGIPRLPAGWPRLTAGLTGVATALIAILLLLRGLGDSGTLAASRVAQVWTLPATGSLIGANPAKPAELRMSFHGTPLPNYSDSEGWHAVGTRVDRFDGAPAFTVFYATGGRRATYTVVARTRVGVPASATHRVAEGLQLAEFRHGDRWVVVFANHGNSCVLTAAAPREKNWLVKLAVWRTQTETTPA